MGLYDNELVEDRMEVYWYNQGYGVCEDPITKFYYDRENNRMINCDGDIVFDIYSYISPNQLMLFKHTHVNTVLIGVSGQLVELIYYREYEEEWDEEDINI